jgi:hypothetical protein
MPLFPEGQDPLDTPGVNPAGRMPPSQESIELNHRQFVQQQAEQQMLAFKIATTLALVAIIVFICFGAWLYRYRIRIAKAADSAVVAGLARGVRFNRKVRAGRKSLMDRVNAKANESIPPDE